MRIKKGDDFATRPSEEHFENKKYFLVFEGEVTEPMYFDGIISNQKGLSISESVSIINVLRSMEDIHNSHPKHVLSLAKEIKESNQQEYITKEQLRKRIVDYIEINLTDNKEELLAMVKDYFENYISDLIYNEELSNVIVDIFKNEMFSSLVNEVSKYLNNQRVILDYNPKIDQVNMIIDRDKSSFKTEKYEELLEECKNKKINLFVSNPSFEVWLLMHFDEFENLDFKKLKENKRVNTRKKSRKYAEKKLSEIIGYDKSSLNFSDFVDKIDKAIDREKKYCENLEGLENNVGTNVGLLIENMRNE